MSDIHRESVRTGKSLGGEARRPFSTPLLATSPGSVSLSRSSLAPTTVQRQRRHAHLHRDGTRRTNSPNITIITKCRKLPFQCTASERAAFSSFPNYLWKDLPLHARSSAGGLCTAKIPMRTPSPSALLRENQNIFVLGPRKRSGVLPATFTRHLTVNFPRPKRTGQEEHKKKSRSCRQRTTKLLPRSRNLSPLAELHQQRNKKTICRRDCQSVN